MKKFKILHSPYNIAGTASTISYFEKQRGNISHVLSFQNYFGFESDFTIESKNVILFELHRWKWFLKAIFYYDILHFNFGHSIFPDWLSTEFWPKDGLTQAIRKVYVKLLATRDLRLYKLFRKKIFVTYQGDDARQSDFCIKNYSITFAKEVNKDYYPKGSDAYKRWKISQFDKFADSIFSVNPDIMNVLPERTIFLPYCHIDIGRHKPIYPKVDNATRPLVVHAPTNRSVKGTKYILKDINRLKKEGVQFDFILIENTTNKEAFKTYKKADILVDQLLAGWYGGLAVELMALGKPVIAYLRNHDLHYVPSEMLKEVPVINASPFSFYRILKRYLTVEKKHLTTLGKVSRRFTFKWHNPLKIVDILLTYYEKS